MSWNELTLIQTADGKNQCPVVDTNNEGFWRIYYSHRDENNHSHTSYIDVEAGNPKNLIKKSKQPVLGPGVLGSIDASGAMASSIITINNIKYMYYVGWSQRLDVPYFNTTCLATSENGDEWYKVGPILSPTIRDPGYSGTFYPILNRSGTQYTALYLSCKEWVKLDGKIEPIYNLRRATSTDGVNWKKHETAINFDILARSKQGGISQASIYYNAKNGIYQTWYSIRDAVNYRDDPNYAYRIKYAESYDLVKWETFFDKQDYDIYPTGNSDDWNGIMTCYPCIVEHEGILFMFYNGNGFGNTGIGVAKWM